MCVCVCVKASVSDELHHHFLPAFKPSQRSLLFNPLSSPLSFLSIILKYLAKIQLCNVFFLPSKSILHLCHLRAARQQQRRLSREDVGRNRTLLM